MWKEGRKDGWMDLEEVSPSIILYGQRPAARRFRLTIFYALSVAYSFDVVRREDANGGGGDSCNGLRDMEDFKISCINSCI